MSNSIWPIVASSAAAWLFGIAAMLALMVRAKRLGARPGQARFAGSLVLGAMLYTMLVACFGQFVLRIPISSTIRDGFGDERITWLLAGLAGDIIIRLTELFYPPKSE